MPIQIVRHGTTTRPDHVTLLLTKSLEQASFCRIE